VLTTQFFTTKASDDVVYARELRATGAGGPGGH
jgi:hypothetical protein